jgi:hypothetical protein
MISYLSDAVDCLYDKYSNQTSRLLSYGYTKEEAFWIHFVSVSFMPWSEQSRNTIPLSHIIKFYALVYRDEIVISRNSISKTFLRCLLKSRFDLAYAMAQQYRKSEPTLNFAFNIGRCALPHVNDSLKHTLAGLFVINTMSASQKLLEYLPLGRLIWDIDNNAFMEKPAEMNYETVPSC